MPFPAGSSPDLIARILAEKLPQSLGQAVVVENRPGAGGNLGTGLVAQAAPDRLLAIAALGFAGCASAPKSELATSYDDGVDRARMTIIEERAARSGVRVFWMNPPRKPSTPSGG